MTSERHLTCLPFRWKPLKDFPKALNVFFDLRDFLLHLFESLVVLFQERFVSRLASIQLFLQLTFRGHSNLPTSGGSLADSTISGLPS